MKVSKNFETAHRQDSMLRRSLSNTDLQRRRTTMQLQGTIATMQKMLQKLILILPVLRSKYLVVLAILILVCQGRQYLGNVRKKRLFLAVNRPSHWLRWESECFAGRLISD